MAATYLTHRAPTAVTFDAAGETETFAFDFGSASNRAAIVHVTWRDRGNDLSGITIDGVSMTSLGAVVTVGVMSCRMFGLAGPASGSVNCAVTMGAGSNSSVAQISVLVLQDVDQASPFDGFTSANGSASTANIVSSVTIASATGDAVGFFHATTNGSQNLSATSTGYTERGDAFNGSGFSTHFGEGSGAATVQGDATWSNSAISVSWIALGVNVNAAAAATGNRRRRVLLHC